MNSECETCSCYLRSVIVPCSAVTIHMLRPILSDRCTCHVCHLASQLEIMSEWEKTNIDIIWFHTGTLIMVCSQSH